MTRQATIRGFAKADLDACYAISLATGFEGGDAAHLYADPRLMGHIYIAPYALLAPDLTLVVEDDDGVAGFVTGATDTVAWEQRLERDWWPTLRSRYPDPSGVPPQPQTADQRRAFMIHHPMPTPAAVVARFPAHLHLNLLPRLQRQGIGSRLLDAWRGTAGARAVHIGVNRANDGAVQFWQSRGFGPIGFAEMNHGRTLWMGSAGH